MKEMHARGNLLNVMVLATIVYYELLNCQPSRPPYHTTTLTGGSPSYAITLLENTVYNNTLDSISFCYCRLIIIDAILAIFCISLSINAVVLGNENCENVKHLALVCVTFF